MLPSALSVSLLLGDSVHYGIRLFGLLRRRCNLRIGLSSVEDGPSSQLAQSPRARDPKRIRTGAVLRATSGSSSPSYLARLPSFSVFPASPSYSPSLSRLLPSFATVGVAQGIVDLPAHPQTVQEYRKLPRHGHHRSLLCVLASAGGYLLAVTS